MLRKSGSSDPAELIKMALKSIDDQISELTQKREQLAKMVPGSASATVRRRGRPPAAAKVVRKPKRVVSDSTRRKLKAAAKARWARIRSERGE